MPSSSRADYAVVFANLPEVKFVCGELVCAASPTIFSGKGFTVSKPGTGVFRVTLNQAVGHAHIGGNGQLKKLAATTEARFLNGVVLADGLNYYEFRVEDATGAAADPATTDRIAFIIPVMRNKLPMK